MPLTPLAYLKLGGAVLGFGLIIALVIHLHGEFATWRQNLYNSGYKAGVTDTNLTWQTASTKAAQQQLVIQQADAAAGRDAVANYLATLRDLTPKLSKLDQQRTIYVTSPAGTAPCLDADGVRLIEQQRQALGINSGAGGATQPPAGATP